jgi:hypothetical protein
VSVAAFVSFTYRCVALPTFASILTIGVKTASRSSYMYTFWFLSICTLRLAVTPLIHRRRTRSKRRLEAFNQIGTPVFRMVRSRRRPKSSRMTIDAVVMTARFRLPHRIISSVLVSPKSKHCITDQVRDWSCVRTMVRVSLTPLLLYKNITPAKFLKNFIRLVKLLHLTRGIIPPDRFQK